MSRVSSQGSVTTTAHYEAAETMIATAQDMADLGLEEHKLPLKNGMHAMDVASRDDAVRKRRRMAPCGASGCERSVPLVRSMPGGVLMH